MARSAEMSENSGEVLKVAFAIAGYTVLCYSLGFIAGDKIDKEEMMEQFQEWNFQEQQDFILAAVSDKSSLRREIAEDWCAINKNTQRVCWNAKLNHPIRGAK